MQNNKIIVVTGSYQGNGEKICKIFLEKNFKVYCLDFRYKKKIQISKNLIQYKINLEKENEIISFCNYIKKKEKKIDCLVNNAGISIDKKNIKIRIIGKKLLKLILQLLIYYLKI